MNPSQQSHLSGAVRSPGRFQVQGGPAIGKLEGDNQGSILVSGRNFFFFGKGSLQFCPSALRDFFQRTEPQR